MIKNVTGLSIALLLFSCNPAQPSQEVLKEQKVQSNTEKTTRSNYLRPYNKELPTIGLLLFDGVLQGEVIASSDVFAKYSKDGAQLFNVVTIAESLQAIVTEEGLRLLPDYTFDDCPKLQALFIPSAYDMHALVNNQKCIEFIQKKNQETDYIVSNCAGAQLIGKSGVADGYQIVTWIGGGTALQKDYPKLKVQNDSLVSYVSDGKFSSSNGNLASYISALNLLEKMTSAAHKAHVESYLYLDQLQEWAQRE